MFTGRWWLASRALPTLFKTRRLPPVCPPPTNLPRNSPPERKAGRREKRGEALKISVAQVAYVQSLA